MVIRPTTTRIRKVEWDRDLIFEVKENIKRWACEEAGNNEQALIIRFTALKPHVKSLNLTLLRAIKF